MADPWPSARTNHRKDGGGIIYAEPPAHAYDPQTNPEFLEGALARRFVGFIVDLIIIVRAPTVAAIFISYVGLIAYCMCRRLALKRQTRAATNVTLDTSCTLCRTDSICHKDWFIPIYRSRHFSGLPPIACQAGAPFRFWPLPCRHSRAI